MRGFEALFPHAGTLGCVVCLTPQLFLPAYPDAHKCGTTCSTSCQLASPLHPGCPSLPLLLVWMSVSSLTPWLSDFHTVQFSGSSGYFFVFKFVVVLLLVVRGGKVYLLPTPPSWPAVSEITSYVFVSSTVPTLLKHDRCSINIC